LDASSSRSTETPIRPVPPAGLPFERWGIDFIQDLPETINGYKHIITAIDYATRWVVAKPVKERTSAEMSRFLYEEILMNYGCPYEIFSDRASALLSESMSNYLELQTIRHKATTPYHPQTNGMVERMHAMMGHSITTLSNSQPERWDEFLPQTVFAIRVRTHAVSKKSPFYMLYGVSPRIPGDTEPPRVTMQPWSQSTMEDYMERNFDDLEMARGLAYMRSKEQAEAMKKRHACAEASPDFYFKINDWVKLKNYAANKFEFSWKGPYAVVDVGFPGTYWLMDTNGRRLDSTVNQRDLAPWLSGINDNQSYFHDGTRRTTDPESTDEPLDVYISTLYDRYMGDCVIS
jgi:transposase InsO family protein